MPRKSTKVSDLDKEWIKRRTGKSKKISPEYHLIICEGTKTEPFYFEALSNIINNKYKGRISLIPKGKGKGTLQLVEEAKKEQDKSNKEIKHVWIVYDKDEFPKDDFDNTFYKCKNMKSYKGAKYHALYSNECIELWFLLHFKAIDVAHNRKEYMNMLDEEFKNNKLGKYSKNNKETCQKLLPYLETAIENAEKINEMYSDKDSPWKRNPSTKIYELMNILKVYLK